MKLVIRPSEDDAADWAALYIKVLCILVLCELFYCPYCIAATYHKLQSNQHTALRDWTLYRDNDDSRLQEYIKYAVAPLHLLTPPLVTDASSKYINLVS